VGKENYSTTVTNASLVAGKNFVQRGTLLAFAANLDFSCAAAGLAFAATPAHGTRGFISECGAHLVSRGFSSAVATCAIPVARRVTIVATQGGHPAPPANFCDSDPGFRLCQTEAVGGSGLFWSSIKQTAARPRNGWPLQMQRLPSHSVFCSGRAVPCSSGRGGHISFQTRSLPGPDFAKSQENSTTFSSNPARTSYYRLQYKSKLRRGKQT